MKAKCMEYNLNERTLTLEMAVNLDLSNKSKLFLSITLCCLIVLATYTQRDVFSLTSHTGSQSSQITFLTNPKDIVRRSQTVTTAVQDRNDTTPDFSGKVLKDVYRQGFENTMPYLCSESTTNVTLLIIITSAPKNVKSRTAIRQTWGLLHRRAEVVVAFMVGVQDDPVIARSLVEENALYKDVITERNVDSYRNLTLKTMAIFEWVRTYCPKAMYILKTDDDMFINVPRLLEFVTSLPKTKGRIYGRLATKWPPIRDKKSKYYISENDFNGLEFPDFTTGPAYLTTPDVASALYETALSLAFIPLEDVFFTGVVAQKVGVTRVSVPRFTNNKLTHTMDPCVVRNAFAFHQVIVSDQFAIWRDIVDDKFKC